MTIDEEIVFERKLADYYKKNHLKNEAREHEQLAEWLEELKEARHCMEENRKAGYNHGFVDGYNKALDDFAENAIQRYHEFPTTLCYTEEIVKEISEQLKAGDWND